MIKPEFSADAAIGWCPLAQQLPRPRAPWRQWLCAPGSLTRRLCSLSQGDFSVQVLEEGWTRPHGPALQSCFSGPVLRQRMWSRKVLLIGNGQVWVAAHTLMPQSSLRGPLRSLIGINNKPLGAFLFQHRSLERQQFEVARRDDCWARRSLFYLAGSPILVAECFLPALVHSEPQRVSQPLII